MKSTAHVKTTINLKRIKLCTANNASELQNTNKIIIYSFIIILEIVYVIILQIETQ